MKYVLITIATLVLVLVVINVMGIVMVTFVSAPFIGYFHIRRLGYPPTTSAGLVLGVAVVAILITIATAVLIPGPENLWGGVGLTLLCIGMAITISGLGCRILISRLPKREFRISGRRRVGFRSPFSATSSSLWRLRELSSCR